MKVHDYLDFHAQQCPSAEFAAGADCKLTYRAAQQQANRVAQAMICSGLRRGDRVALLMKNSVDAVVAHAGASKAGLVATPISHRLTPTNWQQITSFSPSVRPRI